MGMNHLKFFLLVNRKELRTINAEESEEARQYLEEGLSEEIEGNEMDEEVRRIADEILDGYFFED